MKIKIDPSILREHMIGTGVVSVGVVGVGFAPFMFIEQVREIGSINSTNKK